MELHKISRESLQLLGDENWLSIISLFDLNGQSGAQFMAEKTIDIPQSRLSQYIGFVHAKYISPYLRCFNTNFENITLRYVFQGEDCPRNFKSIAFETQAGWDQVCVVPDLYYFLDQGHEAFLPDGAAIPSWSIRKSVVMWRGSTTGVIDGADLRQIGFSAETLDRLPRYKLCSKLSALGERADVGIVALVQCPDWERDVISARLSAESLTAPFVPMHEMVNYKFLVDIDGNTNAWNFIQRLRLGCCILKVETPWLQWISGRVEPWKHYVPVKADLSDLLEKIDWCLTHDQEAKEIATNARNFGLGVEFEAEMQQAALNMIAASVTLDNDESAINEFNRACAAGDKLRPAWIAAINSWLKFPDPVWLKTAHGTILGARADGAIMQLHLDGDLSQAITLFDGNSQWAEQLKLFQICRSGYQVSLEHAGMFLCASNDRTSTSCDRPEKHEWETFTLIRARS